MRTLLGEMGGVKTNPGRKNKKPKRGRRRKKNPTPQGPVKGGLSKELGSKSQSSRGRKTAKEKKKNTALHGGGRQQGSSSAEPVAREKTKRDGTGQGSIHSIKEKGDLQKKKKKSRRRVGNMLGSDHSGTLEEGDPRGREQGRIIRWGRRRRTYKKTGKIAEKKLNAMKAKSPRSYWTSDSAQKKHGFRTPSFGWGPRKKRTKRGKASWTLEMQRRRLKKARVCFPEKDSISERGPPPKGEHSAKETV